MRPSRPISSTAWPATTGMSSGRSPGASTVTTATSWPWAMGATSGDW
jgi:hypothetical protein